VQSRWVNTSWQVLRHGKARLNIVVDLWIDIHHFVNEAPLPFLLLFSCHLDEVLWWNHLLRVLFYDFDQRFEVLSVARQINDLFHFFLIKVALVTLLLEIRVDYLAPD